MVGSNLALISYRSILKQGNTAREAEPSNPHLSLYFYFGVVARQRKASTASKKHFEAGTTTGGAGGQVARAVLTTEEVVMLVWLHCRFHMVGS